VGESRSSLNKEKREKVEIENLFAKRLSKKKVTGGIPNFYLARRN